MWTVPIMSSAGPGGSTLIWTGNITAGAGSGGTEHGYFLTDGAVPSFGSLGTWSAPLGHTLVYFSVADANTSLYVQIQDMSIAKGDPDPPTGDFTGYFYSIVISGVSYTMLPAGTWYSGTYDDGSSRGLGEGRYFTCGGPRYPVLTLAQTYPIQIYRA